MTTENRKAGPAATGAGLPKEEDAMTATTDHAQHIADMRAAVAQMWERDDDTKPLAVIGSIIDFAEAKGLYLTGGEIDLWGFGRVHPMYRDLDDTCWLRLADLVEPTGLTYAQLLAVFEEEFAEQGPDGTELLRFVSPAGDVVPLVDDDWVMRVFATRSPWAKEFKRNLSQAFRHALVGSGLADRLGASATGVTAVASMRTTGGEDLKIMLPVESYGDDEVPLVRNPFDDAAPGELVPVTALTDSWWLDRSGEVAAQMFAPSTTRSQAAALAFRGPVLDDQE